MNIDLISFNWYCKMPVQKMKVFSVHSWWNSFTIMRPIFFDLKLMYVCNNDRSPFKRMRCAQGVNKEH